MAIDIALIRQEHGGSDGGAQATIDQMLHALGNKQNINVALLCRKWESPADSVNKIIIDPAFHGRRDKLRTFNQAINDYLSQHQFDVIQSHERINGCQVFRAGDGVHKIWLQHRAHISNVVQRWWLSKLPHHRALLAEEKLMFESDCLKKVICNSNMVKQEILNNFAIAKDKLVVIYNAVDTERFKPAKGNTKAALRAALGIPEQALVFIFSGSGFERKNLGATIRAFSQLPENCYLLVVGRDKNHNTYHRLADKTGCRSRVNFLGAQEKSKMPKLYQLADVLVLPTIYDPFPNVILEGLATGLPCITTSNCGAVDVIPDAGCGVIIEAGDDHGLMEAMAGYQNEQRRKVESVRARRLAATFTQQRMEDKLLSLYAEILDQ